MTAGQSSLFPRGRRPIGRTRRGLDTTVKAMRDLGRLEPIDTALVALARVAADQLDAACADPDESRYSCGVLIGRYQTVLESLLLRPESTDDDVDKLAALFAGLPDGTG